MQEVERVAETREVDSHRNGRDGYEPRHQSMPTLSLTDSLPRYCLTYGRPSAAGGTVRPMTPATATSVSRYGSAWNNVP